ncbi:unnamed protein product [Calypogeia fissa]
MDKEMLGETVKEGGMVGMFPMMTRGEMINRMCGADKYRTKFMGKAEESDSLSLSRRFGKLREKKPSAQIQVSHGVPTT